MKGVNDACKKNATKGGWLVAEERKRREEEERGRKNTSGEERRRKRRFSLSRLMSVFVVNCCRH